MRHFNHLQEFGETHQTEAQDQVQVLPQVPEFDPESRFRGASDRLHRYRKYW